MSVSGSNQGVRFGVATSTNRPSTPFDGQVIYETDTDRIMAYDGTNWIPQVSAGTINAKGDLLVGTADNTVARLAVGANGTVLTADSGETGGMKWGGVLGLEFISSTTIGSAVSSVTVSNAFSATYENYEIIVSGGSAAANANLGFQLGATTTGYYAGYVQSTYAAGTVSGLSDSNASSWTRFGLGDTTFLNFKATIFSPFSAKNTAFVSASVNPSTTGYCRFASGFLNNTTSYTDFTVTGTSNLTGGTIKVYGHRN